MSTGDGDGPEQDPPEGKERRRTPPPGSRTPPPRTRAGDRDEVEHRAIRRERERGSVFSRMLGRGSLDEALQERFEPYEYQSSRPLLRWVFLALLLFTAAGAFAIYADFQFRGQINEWRSQGFTEIPIKSVDVAQGTLIADLETRDPDEILCNPGELETSSVIAQGCRSIDRVFEYAQREGIDCLTLEDLASISSDAVAPSAGCDQLVELTTRYQSMNDRSNYTTIAIVFLLIVTAFPFSSFIHRSSRNLRTLKSQGQKHSPDGAVIRFFVPVINIYKPMAVITEMFKASDPRVPDSDDKAWQKKGSPSPIAIIWAAAWGASVIFNPVMVTQLFFRQRTDLGDSATAVSGLIVADILIVILGVLAILMANTLSHWQDARAAKCGTVTVTPPRPRDPLEKALEEGVRRGEDSSIRTREGRSRRRRK